MIRTRRIEPYVSMTTDSSIDPSRPWDSDPLRYMIGETDRAAFLAQYYEREPLIVRHADAARFQSLISIDAIDAFIAGFDLREGDVDLTASGRTIARSRYVNDNGLIDRGVVVREYQQGATVILPQRHQSDRLLASLCRALERIFSCHVQTNVYLTPGGAQGFPPHYDNHDVFVLQVSGAKHWRLYQRAVDTPYRGEGFKLGDHVAGELVEDFILNPGEAAYVPRGLMHDAENVGDAPSLHVTVGLIAKTWADLILEAVSEVAVAEPAFRRALPAGHSLPGYDREAARAIFTDLMRTLGERASMDRAFDLIVDQFVRGRDADTRGALTSSLDAVHDKRFVARRAVQWRMAEEQDGLILIGPGGDMRFPLADNDALERALGGAPFLLDDLASEKAEEMIRRLWAFGLIEHIR